MNVPKHLFPNRKGLTGEVSIYDGNDELIATVYDHSKSMDEMAVARLFAAAPKMLELLRRRQELDDADLPETGSEYREWEVKYNQTHAEIKQFLKAMDKIIISAQIFSGNLGEG